MSSNSLCFFCAVWGRKQWKHTPPPTYLPKHMNTHLSASVKEWILSYKRLSCACAYTHTHRERITISSCWSWYKNYVWLLNESFAFFLFIYLLLPPCLGFLGIVKLVWNGGEFYAFFFLNSVFVFGFYIFCYSFCLGFLWLIFSIVFHSKPKSKFFLFLCSAALSIMVLLSHINSNLYLFCHGIFSISCRSCFEKFRTTSWWWQIIIKQKKARNSFYSHL